jgi:protein-S-isoprenylcysteine O-methyltransferase Ste14
MTANANDTAGIRFPPPLYYLGGFVLGEAIHQFAPIRLWAPPALAPRVVGWALVALWAAVSVAAVTLLRRAGTTPNPAKPTTALVIRGPYRFSRNPLYVAVAALYLGAALLANSLWPLLLFPAVIALVRTRVIAREEAYLEAKFGDAYRAYKARVRRWL